MLEKPYLFIEIETDRVRAVAVVVVVGGVAKRRLSQIASHKRICINVQVHAGHLLKRVPAGHSNLRKVSGIQRELRRNIKGVIHARAQANFVLRAREQINARLLGRFARHALQRRFMLFDVALGEGPLACALALHKTVAIGGLAMKDRPIHIDITRTGRAAKYQRKPRGGSKRRKGTFGGAGGTHR